MADRDIAGLYTGSGVIKYPNPFFDLSKNYMPKSIKTLFEYCRTFYYTNDFINNVVKKLTEYPITDILFENAVDRKAEKAFADYFDNKLHLKNLLISVGLDYFTYGNCFVTAQLATKRYLRDSNDNQYEFTDLVNISYKDGKITANIKNYGTTDKLTLEIVDIPIKNVDGLIFNRLNPSNIEIEFDEFTGGCEYYYLVPADVKRKIRANNITTLKNTPKIILEAVSKNKRVKLDKKNLYHFKAPTLSEDDRGWGKPHILPAMKKLYYMATLMRGNEAIAVEHIVPKKVVFPSPNGSFDLHNMGLSKWKSSVESSIRIWKSDPNHIAIFPIPMGYQELGGTGRSLLLTPELKFLEETIVNGLGVPIEFIKGGASWTGSSVSLRIIENHFINYRERLEDFINHFIVAKMVEFLGFSKVKIKFTRMRMNDDSETKQMAINLNAQNRISDETLLKELHYDPHQEKIRIKEEAEFKRDLAVEDATAQAEAQGMAQVILARYQVMAQQEAQDEESKQEERLFRKELEGELGVDEEGIHRHIKKLTNSILLIPDPKKQEIALNELYKQSPVSASMVAQRIAQRQAEAAMEQTQLEQIAIDQEKQRVSMAKDIQQIKDGSNSPTPVRTRNEDKSGPKRDAQSGKQKT